MLHDTTGSASHPPQNAGWTNERVELLKKLWSDGLSASKSAAKLGVTRNAVIGKVSRLKLSSHGSNAPKPAPKKASKKIAAAKASGGNGSAGKYRGVVQAARKARSQNHPAFDARPPKALPIPPDLPELSARRRLIDLGSNECRYCSGDPLTADHSFCGKPVKEGASWCPEHYARVFPLRG